MPGLGDTTAMLARLRRQSPSMSSGTGRLERIDEFGPNPGQLAMLSYSPEGLAPRSPLVVVLHGCTQTATTYAEGAGWLALADRFGFAVLAPEQTTANNPNRCFNWFSPGDVRRGEGEAGSIASMVAYITEAKNLDPTRVFVTGLSAGGAMAAAMLAAYPDVFAAGAVIAGLPYGVARNVQDAMRVMSRPDGRPAAALAELAANRTRAAPAPRLAIWHGDADFTVNVGNAHDLAQQWSALHGLPSAPHRVEQQSFGARSIWRSASGEALVEMNLVRGLGHGAPLSTGGVDDVGRVAPYMLEAGVSSSLEIARFWKIDTRRSETVASRRPEDADGTPDAKPSPMGHEPAQAASLGHNVMSALSQVPVGVQETIAKALRAAGLMS